MNRIIEVWVGNSFHPDKANALLEAMNFLSTITDPEIEVRWMGWANRVNIDDNASLASYLQQHLLDVTIQSIEQFDIMINEDVSFNELLDLSIFLRALYDLDKVEPTHELRSILTGEMPNADKLIAALKNVSLFVTDEFLVLIESVSDALLLKLLEITELDEEIEEVPEEVEVYSDALEKLFADWPEDDDILGYYLNDRPMGYTLQQYLGIFSSLIADTTSPELLAKRCLVLYLFSGNDLGQARTVLSNVIALLAGDGSTEIKASMALDKLVGELS